MVEASGVPPPARRISSIFLILTLVMLILSLASLFQVFDDYRRGTLNLANVILSLSAITISIYMFFQLRTKPLKLGFEPQKVLTTTECLKCGYKNVRDFQKGEFIFKAAEPCPKCNVEMLISSIYRKFEEKKK